MFRKTIGSLLLALAALVPTAACARAPEARPALWKLADEDTTIYLFGTVHALPDGVAWFRGPVADALTGSDEVVTEIIMDETMPAKMQALVAEKGMLPQAPTSTSRRKGQTLDSHHLMTTRYPYSS